MYTVAQLAITFPFLYGTARDPDSCPSGSHYHTLFLWHHL